MLIRKPGEYAHLKVKKNKASLVIAFMYLWTNQKIPNPKYKSRSRR